MPKDSIATGIFFHGLEVDTYQYAIPPKQARSFSGVFQPDDFRTKESRHGSSKKYV